MKPRIVRANNENGGIFADFYHGPAALVLYWPKVGTGAGECPYTPEQVMAACEARQWTLLGIPRSWTGVTNGWRIYVSCIGSPDAFLALTPEFIGEPKCDAPGHEWTPPENCYSVCPKCNAILSDRRHGERRQLTKRRKIGPTYGGGRRIPKCPPNRRTGKDRRKS